MKSLCVGLFISMIMISDVQAKGPFQRRRVTTNHQAASHNANSYAASMAASGQFTHDRSYNGRENIFFGWKTDSNGNIHYATEADAIRAWKRSPGHRANLPYITDIKCVNGYCVGR